MTRIVTEDAEGRVVDLHAMRTTLKHYTVLGLSDTAGAINELPDIGRTEPIKATGTLCASADPQQIH